MTVDEYLKDAIFRCRAMVEQSYTPVVYARLRAEIERARAELPVLYELARARREGTWERLRGRFAIWRIYVEKKAESYQWVTEEGIREYWIQLREQRDRALQKRGSHR